MTDQRETRERLCEKRHQSMSEAIRCAEKNLGIGPGQKLQPYWGTTNQNAGLIVGWQVSPRKRWRLDYDARPGGKGPHINEENFEMPAYLAKMAHLIARPAISGELQVIIQQQKWTRAGNVEK